MLKAGVGFAAGAVAFWVLTRDWGRALSYATGFTIVLIVGDSLRVYRGRGDQDAKDAPEDDGPPPLFGNG